MKIANPYKCNGCARPMGETSDGWYLGSVVQVNVEHSIAGDAFRNGAFILAPWHDARAEVDDVEHLCSVDCALKSAGKWLAAQSPDTHSVKQSFTLNVEVPA